MTGCSPAVSRGAAIAIRIACSGGAGELFPLRPDSKRYSRVVTLVEPLLRQIGVQAEERGLFGWAALACCCCGRRPWLC